MSVSERLRSLFLRSSLGRSAGIFTIMNVLVSGIPFIMLPILTRYLSPSDYGIVAMYQVLEAFLYPVAALGIHWAVHRQYFELDKHELAVYICNCFMVLFACTTIISLLLWCFSGFIAQWTSFPEQWLWAIPVTALCRTIHSTVIMLLLARVRPFPYAFFQAILVGSVVALSLIFVVVFGMRWEGRVLGQVISFGVLGVLCTVYLWLTGWLRFSIRKEYVRHVLSFGSPLVPHEIGVNAINMGDRLFLANMVGVAETGIYVVAFQVSRVLSILEDSFNQAWMPWAFRHLKEGGRETKIKLVRITYACYVAMLILAAVLATASPWLLIPLVGADFLPATRFLVWLALGQAFYGMSKLVATYLFYVKKTSTLGWIAVLTVVSNFSLNYTLISAHGSVGAAEAFFGAYLLSFLLTWHGSAKNCPMPYLSVFRTHIP